MKLIGLLFGILALAGAPQHQARDITIINNNAPRNVMLRAMVQELTSFAGHPLGYPEDLGEIGQEKTFNQFDDKSLFLHLVKTRKNKVGEWEWMDKTILHLGPDRSVTMEIQHICDGFEIARWEERTTD